MAGLRRIQPGRITPIPAWPVYADFAFVVSDPLLAGLRRLSLGLNLPIAETLSSIKSSPYNSPLFGQLEKLCAGALHDIKNM